ncbi:MAG: metal-dependent transcriptional regulator [Methanomicrobiales archaeon]
MVEKPIKLTESIEDYLEVMYILKKSKGSIKVKDIASRLDVKPPSVVQAIQRLSDKGLLTYQRYGDINLTEKGLKLAKEIVHKHHILRDFLITFGIDKETAEKDACAMEHILSPLTIKKMNKFVKFINQKPEAAEIIQSFQEFELDN